MKKLLSVVAFMAVFCLGKAQAYDQVYDKGFSTWTVAGVRCSTGTAINLSATLSGFDISAYRFRNTDTADSVLFGYNSDVSSHTSTAAGLAALGEELTSGSNGVWELGYNPETSAAVEIWCKTVDAAGAAGVILSRAVFGYK